jgi:hypothetical protein
MKYSAGRRGSIGWLLRRRRGNGGSMLVSALDVLVIAALAAYGQDEARSRV